MAVVFVSCDKDRSYGNVTAFLIIGMALPYDMFQDHHVSYYVLGDILCRLHLCVIWHSILPICVYVTECMSADCCCVSVHYLFLQETLVPGDGKTYPKPNTKLTMHYIGTLASNGSKFDASRDRGRPFSFTIGVGQVIRGWDEGVMQMSLGEKAILKITSDYGYGARGAGGVIPPNADLNFEVELLAIADWLPAWLIDFF